MATDPPTVDMIDRTIREEIARHLERADNPHPALSGDQTLEALGFSSLDLFELAESLDAQLLVDPFGQTIPLSDLRTIDDLCRAYRSACVRGEGSPDEILLASRRRAAARRRPRNR